MTDAQRSVAPPATNVVSQVDPPNRRRAVMAATVGHFVEYYDYTVYGYFAAIIGTHFFPTSDPVASVMAAFAAFALAFAARPIGGLVFGHFGDRIGRRTVLSVSILMMGLGSLIIGALPSYAAIGVWAPILLVFARLMQGFSTGGENAGASAFLVEYAPANRRGLATSWQQFALILALLAGSGVSALLRATMPEAAFNDWGWRLPFLLGALLAAVGLYLRLRLEDTPAFQRLATTSEVARVPIVEAIREHGRAVLTCGLFYISPGIASYILLIYMPTYASTVFGLPASQALLSNTIALALLLALIPVLGALSDRVGRKRLLIIFNAGLVIATYPLILLFANGTFTSVLVAQLVFAALFAFFFGPGTAMAAELFPTRVRYTGFAIGNNVATALFGGTAPFIATWLIAGTGNTTSPALMLIAGGLVSLIVVLRMRETSRLPLQ
ncbi:MFS transporter [Saccharomonospora sp. NPDC046836]|uniref:MFS transporter n=1 Tax=Saccharomonospora sp. NPDC046836 TaxID=3156921 RepID=UPI0033EEEB46